MRLVMLLIKVLGIMKGIDKNIKTRKRIKKSRVSYMSPNRKIYNWVLISCFACYVLYQCSVTTYNDYQLKRHGKQVMAYVYDSYSQRSHTWYLYEFTVNGQNYYGRLFNFANIGDSVKVIYMPNNPNINSGLDD